ncbi:MAG: MATE family efflux transporter [Porphyromonas sp.]|nr:MATE family efflux transporter [Porphyromonas sp.]
MSTSSSQVASWQMDRRILRLALPNILTNITVPLLGIVDLALAGHLSEASAIAGVAIATTIFNLIYWNFSFLRMGTTGLTAQAHGAGDERAMGVNLGQSLFIGLTFGLAILLLQRPILQLNFLILRPESQLRVFASTYYNIVIWGAPAILATYALNGWIIGMQNTWWPMVVSIISNVTNIATSATLVLAYHWEVEGLATGTLVAQWLGALLLAAGAWVLFIRKQKVTLPRRFGDLTHGIRRYFDTNIHIYLRTMLIALVSLFFTYVGTREGAMVLAANALLYQFFTFFSYFIDGFAFAAEALVGHFYGQRDRASVRHAIRLLMRWGLALALVVTVVYLLGARPFLGFLTDKPEVIAVAERYLIWVYLIPLAGFAAFIYDGIFIGVTATRKMLFGMIVAVVVFLGLFYIAPIRLLNGTADPIIHLWFAFLLYLAVRGVVFWIMADRLEGIGKPFAQRYYVLVGSTHLDEEQQIRQALREEWGRRGVLSPFYLTYENGAEEGGRQYINAVLQLQSGKSLEELRTDTKRIERAYGRRVGDKVDVALDLDIVVCEGEVLRPADYETSYFQRGYRYFTF